MLFSETNRRVDQNLSVLASVLVLQRDPCLQTRATGLSRVGLGLYLC